MEKVPRLSTRLLAGAVVLCVSLSSGLATTAAQTFQFSDYPSPATLSVRPSGPDDAKAPASWAAVNPIVKDVIRDDIAKNGPNFAGAYYLATVGCGSGCEAIFVIDLYDGAVFEAPVSATNGVLFQPDSQLIIVRENAVYELPRKYLTFDGALFGELN